MKIRTALAALALLVASLVSASPASAASRHCGVRIAGQPQPPACVATAPHSAVAPHKAIDPADWWWGTRPVR